MDVKRVAFACILLMVTSAAASAAGITFGVKGGLYSANTTEVPSRWGSTSFKNGFAGGAYLDYRIDDNFSVQPEVLYVRKGPDGSFGRGPFASTFTAKYDYIEIPVLAKYKITTKSTIIPYLLMGPSFGVNVASKLDVETPDPITHGTQTGSIDYSSVMNTTEFTWIFGAGFSVGLGPGEVTFDARFDLGLSKVYKGGTVTGHVGDYEFSDTMFPGSNKNVGFALLLGYTL